MTNRHWQAERAKFSRFRTANPAGDYRDWQPAKWQSLSRVRRQVLEFTEAAGHPIGSVLELGCGSATLLIQFALHGLRAIGIDRDRDALALAVDSLESLAAGSARAKAPGPLALCEDDFLRQGAVSGGATDLVMSIGVIEHYELPEQERVLRLHGDASRRWVLLAVPNLDSPLFQTFLRARTEQDAVYDDAHQPIDVARLADACGYRVAIDDGCHLFLSHPDDRSGSDAELAAFDRRVRDQLTRHDSQRFADYPDVDLCSGDITVLSAVEDATDAEMRRRFGFLRWYLLDRAA